MNHLRQHVSLPHSQMDVDSKFDLDLKIASSSCPCGSIEDSKVLTNPNVYVKDCLFPCTLGGRCAPHLSSKVSLDRQQLIPDPKHGFVEML